MGLRIHSQQTFRTSLINHFQTFWERSTYQSSNDLIILLWTTKMGVTFKWYELAKWITRGHIYFFESQRAKMRWCTLRVKHRRGGSVIYFPSHYASLCCHVSLRQALKYYGHCKKKTIKAEIRSVQSGKGGDTRKKYLHIFHITFYWLTDCTTINGFSHTEEGSYTRV